MANDIEELFSIFEARFYNVTEVAEILAISKQKVRLMGKVDYQKKHNIFFPGPRSIGKSDRWFGPELNAYLIQKELQNIKERRKRSR